MSHLNPKWDVATHPLETVCNGDLNQAVKLVVKDYRARFGKHLIIGEFETTLRHFIDCKEEGGDVDVNVAFTLRRDNKDVGNVLVLQAAAFQPQGSQGLLPPAIPDFYAYLSGGCQINLAVAIDFTASNGKHHV
jgi:hypothetical protein